MIKKNESKNDVLSRIEKAFKQSTSITKSAFPKKGSSKSSKESSKRIEKEFRYMVTN